MSESLLWDLLQNGHRQLELGRYVLVQGDRESSTCGPPILSFIPVAMPHEPRSVGSGYSMYASHSGSMSLVVQSLMWWARCNLFGYGKSWMAQTLGKSAWHISINQDRSHVAAPAMGVSGYQGTLGHSPPSRVEPSTRVMYVWKKMFDIFVPSLSISKEFVRSTLPALCMQWMEM